MFHWGLTMPYKFKKTQYSLSSIMALLKIGADKTKYPDIAIKDICTIGIIYKQKLRQNQGF